MLKKNLFSFLLCKKFIIVVIIVIVSIEITLCFNDNFSFMQFFFFFLCQVSQTALQQSFQCTMTLKIE